MDLEKLMEEAGCLESKMIDLGEPGHPRWGHRMRFANEAAALAHRAKTGCGGWVLGPFLFAGTAWTASDVMRHSENEGELK